MKRIILVILLSVLSIYTNKAYATYTPSTPNMLASYENGAYENFSTADTWYKNVNWDSADVFSNFSADLSNGDFYYKGQTADFFIMVNSSVRAPTGALFTQGIFVDESPVDTFSREMTKGPNRMPTFRSISSDGGDATYDTYSSLSFLYYADKDVIQFQEGDIGTTGCYYAVIEYANVDVPDTLILNNVMYDGGVGHYGDVQVWNYDTTSWIDLRTATSDIEDAGGSDDYRKQNTRWAFPSNRTDFVSGGIVRMRIKHNDVACNPAHLLIIDETYVVDRLNSIPFPSFHKITLTNGDIVSVRHKSDLTNSDVIFNHVELMIIEINK